MTEEEPPGLPDDQDPVMSGDGTESADRRRRQSRRATRKATGGVDQVGGRPDQTDDDLDPDESNDQRKDSPQDRWLHEQRPPHWE
ncbi:hypothetical protein [Luteipulveratus mongoliensis]|uniref:Uncharacterized protein n=1 Tax=Luteipulveratus mongoliensis TaxID=571913 RepID=A0A0K1JGM4_9MICO|nr:hypothetical protein [Luteipulveratus mongoliensis]AKU15864.1 hypothetical protein VV02_08375 [Luteipulveratus mongoliensis]